MAISNQSTARQQDIFSRRIIIHGYVQGVGFRPFIFRLAQELGINGYVANNAGQVTVVAEASQKILDIFCERIIFDAPLHASPVIQSVSDSELIHFTDFTIEHSNELSESDIHVLPDLATCEQCKSELFDSKNRRYHYPFINCTQCGPRYSIIKSLPYDRKHTSMLPFSLCDACETEYTNPHDRRFHAEPVACDACGPSLEFTDDVFDIRYNKDALHACIYALQRNKIVAVKGVGGYHLMCDATSAGAIAILRKRKQRPDKPFAILMSEHQVADYVETDNITLELLKQPARPIVLLKQHKNCRLPENLAPDINQLGIMLPNNPLQELLCNYLKKPLVATSANVSGEPIITRNHDATKLLKNLCDAYLHHNREIVRPADDSVISHHKTQTQLIRGGRGFAPIEFDLAFTLDKPVLAVGGHIKNTIALAWKNRLVISAHNGNLTNLRSYQTFKQVINDFQHLYQVKAEQIICDAHPDYGSTYWARQQTLPVHSIFHHHAHASSLALEHPEVTNWLIFSWDGVGLGTDDTLWGGETFSGRPGSWNRLVSFRPFYLPGGDKTARMAWRVAASLNWQTGIDYNSFSQPSEQLKTIWQNKINCPESSAVGRLFSAAASLTGLVDNESFEGHGPLLLQALAETTEAEAIELPLYEDKSGLQRIDWQPLVHMLNDNSLQPAYRARCFHESLAQVLCKIAVNYHKQNPDSGVGLSGGVFQNLLLLDIISQRLQQHNIRLFTPTRIPANDGGLCAGQVIEYFYSSQVSKTNNKQHKPGSTR